MTIRQFKLIGSSTACTGTITINGTTVFDGAFASDSYVVSGSVDVNNDLAIDSQIQVSMQTTVSAGELNEGLFLWDHAQVPNPIYSDEQYAVINNPESTNTQCLEIYNIVAVPPLSEADQIMLMTTNPADYAVRQAVKLAHNLNHVVQNPAVFSCGNSSETNACNRTNVLLNGVEPPNAYTHVGIFISSGDVLTANLVVFASNIWPAI